MNIDKEKVLKLLDIFHKTHFGNIECDTCQNGNDDFFELINTIKNLE